MKKFIRGFSTTIHLRKLFYDVILSTQTITRMKNTFSLIHQFNSVNALLSLINAAFFYIKRRESFFGYMINRLMILLNSVYCKVKTSFTVDNCSYFNGKDSTDLRRYYYFLLSSSKMHKARRDVITIDFDE